MDRYDYQQQLEEDQRRQEEDREWFKHWRESWEQWQNEPFKEKSNAENR